MRKFSKTYTYIYIGILGLAMLVPPAARADSYVPPAAQYTYSYSLGDSDGSVTVSAPGNGYVTNYGTPPNPVSSGNSGDPQLASVNYNIGGPNTTVIAKQGVVSVPSYNGFFDEPVICTAGGCLASGATAYSTINYYFTVVGSSPGAVTVIGTGQASFQVIGGASAGANAEMFSATGGSPSSYSVVCVSTPLQGLSGQCGSNSYALSGTVPVFTAAQLAANPNLYSGSVSIIVQASAGYGQELCSWSLSGKCTSAGYASAFIDPYISIAQDPGDTLLFSPGISNTPSVSAAPEPATLALTGVALLGLVGIQRKRNRK